MNSNANRTAVLLAGGLGSRLRPYTVVLPKPLMPVGDTPILEIIIKQLSRHGFRRIVLAVNHQAELLRAFFGNGERFGVDISYSLEPRALGTMGPLKLMSSLPENFIVMNGDVLCDLDFGEFFERHERDERLFTIAAAKREQLIDFGVLVADEAQQLTGFTEKPRLTYNVSMGVYCVNRRAVEFIPKDEPFGFDQLMLQFIASGEQVHLQAHSGYWLDIGRPDDYQQAVEDWPRLKAGLGL